MDFPPAQLPRPVPSARQLNWHRLELYGFLHFTVNTFTDREWGYGDESPAVFLPTDFDAGQIVGAAKAGGLKGLILTCKHHDGFCLWPSDFTAHSVRSSPWRSGLGDVVGDISAACAHHGLGFGVYLSPWDRNHPGYGSPGYIDYFRRQLGELLGNYGPLFEVWFDGANGGDGYYGGARETRLIDKATYYDWPATWQIVRSLQPGACLFSDAGPDIRWVGNEAGIAGDPCWATLSPAGLAPGLVDFDLLNVGQPDGSAWLPAECDVSIRPGWFYHASEDERVKTPAELVNLYFQSVGRGASLLLNLPPDRRGRIPAWDAAVLQRFHEILAETFAVDLARRALATSPQESPAGQRPAQVNDGDPETYWSPGGAGYPAEVILQLPAPTAVNLVSLREYLPLGQRVAGFACDAWQAGGWVELARGQSIGSRRLLRLPETVTERVRLRLVAAVPPAAPPAISEFALFHSPV